MTQQTSGLEYPEQTYYPRWKCRLILRFLEFGLFGQLQKKVPASPTRSLAGVNPQRGSLQAVVDPSSPPGVTRFVLQAPGDASGAGAFSPQARQQSSDGFTQVVEGIVPTDFRWTQAGLRTASSLNISVPFLACPIDPRTLRSCAVEFYLGTVTAEQAIGAISASNTTVPQGGSSNAGAEPVDLLPDEYTDGNGQPRTNLRFQGWVDAWEGDFDKMSLIHLECTDNTRLLLTIAAPAKAQVSKDLPLDEAIAKYLTFSPTFNGIAVEYRPANVKAPKLADVLHSSAFLPGQGPPVAHMHGATAQKAMVFDYLTDLCRSLAHSLYFDGTTLVIQRVRSLTSAAVQGRADDPYRPRTMPDGSTAQVRRMIYGRNLRPLKLKKNFSNKAPANISVRAYNPDNGQVLVERFPTKEDAQVYALPGDGGAEQKWQEMTMPGGVVDRATMRAYAQEVYESMWRQEIEVEATTKNFASFGGGNLDPDLLDLKFGDPIDILFSRDDYYSTLGPTTKALDAQGANADLLRAAGFPDAFAVAYAKAYTDAGLQSTYRFHQMEVSGSMEEGVALALKLVNYVEVTSDASLAIGEEPVAVPPARPQVAPRAGPPPAGTPSAGF